MCWIGNKNKRKIAEKDIEVYKLGYAMDDEFISLFKNILIQLIV